MSRKTLVETPWLGLGAWIFQVEKLFEDVLEVKLFGCTEWMERQILETFGLGFWDYSFFGCFGKFSHLSNLELSKGSLSIEVLQKTVEIISLCVEVKLCARTFEMQFKYIRYNIYLIYIYTCSIYILLCNIYTYTYVYLHIYIYLFIYFDMPTASTTCRRMAAALQSGGVSA